MENNDKYHKIFVKAYDLFLKQGLEKTTIRQIASEANVSLGLINHFYKSKNDLGSLILNMIFNYSISICQKNLNFEDSLLDTIVMTRVNQTYLANSIYRQIYLECLKNDIYFQELIQIPNASLYNLAKEYHFEVNDDLFLYYGKYMPYNCEKTLMLCKEEGLFISIRDQDIPDYILRSKFEHFIDHDLLENKLDKGRSLSKQILDKMPDQLPEDYIEFYFGNYVVKKNSSD